MQHGLGQNPDVALALGVEHPQRHDLRPGRGQRHQSGHMGAVAVAARAGDADLRGVVVQVDEVAAGQHPVGQRRVAGVHAGVQDRHPQPLAGGERVGLLQSHRCRRPLGDVLPRRADGPHAALASLGGAGNVVGLGDHHAGIRPERCHGRVHARAGRDLKPEDRTRTETCLQTQSVARLHAGQIGAVAQLHQHFTRDAALADRGSLGGRTGQPEGGQQPDGERGMRHAGPPQRES